MKDLKEDNDGEGLNNSMGMGGSMWNQKGEENIGLSATKWIDKSKSFFCHKNDHFTKDCLEKEARGSCTYCGCLILWWLWECWYTNGNK